jgi:hypothetical protein
LRQRQKESTKTGDNLTKKLYKGFKKYFNKKARLVGSIVNQRSSKFKIIKFITDKIKGKNGLI